MRIMIIHKIYLSGLCSEQLISDVSWQIKICLHD